MFKIRQVQIRRINESLEERHVSSGIYLVVLVFPCNRKKRGFSAKCRIPAVY